MSKTVNVTDPQKMYNSFLDIYPELKAMCGGFRIFNWDDRVRKILINLNNIEVKILFGVRRSDESETWDQFSALLIPAPEETEAPRPEKTAEVEIREDM